MNKAETAAGAIFTVLGGLMMLESLRLAYFSEGVPGPGFLPRWVAGGLVLSGVFLAFKGIRPALAPLEAVAWPDSGGWRRIALMLGALAIALLLLDKAGFVLVTAAFMAVMIFVLGGRSWLMFATAPLGAAIALYLVFAVWLKVPLPKGILTFFD